jgi:hypothetical protein
MLLIERWYVAGCNIVYGGTLYRPLFVISVEHDGDSPLFNFALLLIMPFNHQQEILLRTIHSSEPPLDIPKHSGVALSLL